jgi:hypothetical protein
MLLYGTLLFVRTVLPRKDNWNLNLSVNLALQDISYITDSLDFSKILFEDSKKVMNKTYKNIVLWTLAYSSCFFCLNTIYRPAKIHIHEILEDKLDTFEQIEARLAFDPFTRYLIPSLFYEIPITFMRVVIFYGDGSHIKWENFIFLLKNIVGIFLNIINYFELKKFNNDIVFYSSLTN